MNHDLFTNRQLIAVAIDQSKITDQPVQLIGFLRKIRKMGRLVFVDLVDTSGELQLVFQASKITSGLHQITHLLKESVISVSGRIYPRKAINPEQKNGQWEMQVDSWSLVNAAQQLTPFVIDQQIMATEETKLKYRYLELRSHLGERIKARSQIMNLFRQFLLKEGFIEVITPILGQSTIEGARDYLVPTRTKKDPAGFALPQSPQIYKQLLMIGGLERYFQIAINFRDEDLRADRQPEFVQLDIEQAYTNTSAFLSLMEQMFGYVWEKYFHLKLPTPFLQMDYQTAINQYGTDKPDLRFDLLIEDLTNDWKDQLGINNEVVIRGILVKKILSLAQQITLYDLSLALGLKHFFCFTKNDEQ